LELPLSCAKTGDERFQSKSELLSKWPMPIGDDARGIERRGLLLPRAAKEYVPEERLESLKLREKGFETSRLEEMKL
jgi:hypothetical protein